MRRRDFIAQHGGAAARNDGTTVMLAPEYLSKKLTPYPLPTKDGGVLRTIDDVRAYMLAMTKIRKLRAHWQDAWRLLQEKASAAALTRQVQLALFKDGKLDASFEHISNARRWRAATPDVSDV
jgi:hypothetical protein